MSLRRRLTLLLACLPAGIGIAWILGESSTRVEAVE